MELTKFTDYSLRTLIFLAINPDRLVSVSEVADAYRISRNHLVKIAAKLSQLKLIETSRGKGGGMKLAKAPADINIGALVRETEGNSILVECFDSTTNQCCISHCCALKGALRKAQRAFLSELDQYTLADIAKNRATLLSALA